MDQAEAVADFLARGVIEARRDEARKLDALFRQATGFAPRLWPGNILGYGAYAYRYDSGHSGTSLACGFAPRKRARPRSWSLPIASPAGCPICWPAWARTGRASPAFTSSGWTGWTPRRLCG